MPELPPAPYQGTQITQIPMPSTDACAAAGSRPRHRHRDRIGRGLSDHLGGSIKSPIIHPDLNPRDGRLSKPRSAPVLGRSNVKTPANVGMYPLPAALFSGPLSLNSPLVRRPTSVPLRITQTARPCFNPNGVVPFSHSRHPTQTSLPPPTCIQTSLQLSSKHDFGGNH